MADRFDRLDRSFRDLKAAVGTHNRLPEDFPAATIVGICDTLLFHPEGTRSCRLHELVYARDKLANIHEDHFLDEEGAPDAEPGLTRGDRLNQALLMVLGDLGVAVAAFPPEEVERTEESRFSREEAASNATISEIADGAGEASEGLENARHSIERHEAALRAQAEAEYRAVIESLVNARIDAGLLEIEARSSSVRPAWLDRLGRAFARIPGATRTALRALRHATNLTEIIYRGIDDFFQNGFDVVRSVIDKLDDYLGSLQPRSVGPRVFRDVDEPWCPELVEIPPGEFLMGSASEDEAADDDEQPQHRVKIGYRFAVGRYPVTFAEYDAFCEATGRDLPADENWGRARRPAINVSWDDARAYVEWLSAETGRSYRLLSEAEWEYACRAGSTGSWSFGDDESQLEKYAWYGRNSEKKTHPVGEKLPNAFGLYDMHGNVWEWVEDVWQDSYEGDDRPDDGRAWLTGGDKSYRVLRGGSWLNTPDLVRSAFRYRDYTTGRNFYYGFRVSRTLSR